MPAASSGCQKKRYHPVLSALADSSSTVFYVCVPVARWGNSGPSGTTAGAPWTRNLLYKIDLYMHLDSPGPNLCRRGILDGGCGSYVGLRNSILPGEVILIPDGPEKPDQ